MGEREGGRVRERDNKPERERTRERGGECVSEWRQQARESERQRKR